MAHGSSNQKEKSIEEAFSSYLTNEALHDVQLKGTDNVLVGANRCGLAARSPVFERMLLGNFAESKANNVEITGFSGKLVQAIVEYIHTNTCQILKTCVYGEDSVDAEKMRSILSLMEAALYFNLLGLHEKCREWVINALKHFPSLAFVLLVKTGAPLPQELINFALFTVQVKDDVSVPPSAVNSLELSSVQNLLQDDDLRITEFHRFDLLRQWRIHSAPEHSQQNDAVGALEKLIHLELIPPVQLVTTVADSGYFSYQRLYEGLKVHAIAPMQEDKNDIEQYRRSLPVWKESNTLIAESKLEDNHGTEALAVAPFKSGVWQWSIEVKALCFISWLGVTIPDYDPQQWLGMQSIGWVYGQNGAVCHDEESDTPEYDIKFPEYEVGSLVTMTLDLRPGDETTSGSLHASVDGGAPFLLFSGLCKALKEQHGRGFIPAVSLCKPGCMRLVDLKRLED